MSSNRPAFGLLPNAGPCLTDGYQNTRFGLIQGNKVSGSSEHIEMLHAIKAMSAISAPLYVKHPAGLIQKRIPSLPQAEADGWELR